MLGASVAAAGRLGSELASGSAAPSVARRSASGLILVARSSSSGQIFYRRFPKNRSARSWSCGPPRSTRSAVQSPSALIHFPALTQSIRPQKPPRAPAQSHPYAFVPSPIPTGAPKNFGFRPHTCTSHTARNRDAASRTYVRNPRCTDTASALNPIASSPCARAR